MRLDELRRKKRYLDQGLLGHGWAWWSLGTAGLWLHGSALVRISKAWVQCYPLMAFLV